jgi:hypothetical protein
MNDASGMKPFAFANSLDPTVAAQSQAVLAELSM